MVIGPGSARPATHNSKGLEAAPRSVRRARAHGIKSAKKRHMEEPERGVGGDSVPVEAAAAARRAGLRRRREIIGHGLTCHDVSRDFDYSIDLGTPKCDNVRAGGGHNGSGGSGRRRWDGGIVGASSSSAKWPAKVTFLAHALLSFVGVVLIPTRLTYELLIRPESFAEANETRALAHGVRAGIAPAVGGRAPSLFDSGKDNSATGSVLASATLRRQSRGAQAGDGGGGRGAEESNGLKGSGWVAGERNLQESEGGDGEEEDSFTFTAKTQFYLCSAVLELNGGVMQTAVEEVFGVVESQVKWSQLKRTKTTFCESFLSVSYAMGGAEPKKKTPRKKAACVRF